MSRGKVWIGLLLVALAVMVLLALSIPLFELLNIEKSHPLYRFFWFFPNRTLYDVFWVIYWGVGFTLICRLGVLVFRELRRKRIEVVER
ncbi:hypothetical protein J7L06_04005 [Candidatus Bathyarchaeota archaeon]|nr:hypothetical protein [Candidatus Bathyarchaeota archaeon]